MSILKSVGLALVCLALVLLVASPMSALAKKNHNDSGSSSSSNDNDKASDSSSSSSSESTTTMPSIAAPTTNMPQSSGFPGIDQLNQPARPGIDLSTNPLVLPN